MANIKFEIIKEMGALTDNNSVWQKCVRLISWNGAEQKIDVRAWNTETNLPAKGITLNNEEARRLYEILGDYFAGKGDAQ